MSCINVSDSNLFLQYAPLSLKPTIHILFYYIFLQFKFDQKILCRKIISSKLIIKYKIGQARLRQNIRQTHLYTMPLKYRHIKLVFRFFIRMWGVRGRPILMVFGPKCFKGLFHELLNHIFKFYGFASYVIFRTCTFLRKIHLKPCMLYCYGKKRQALCLYYYLS